MNFRRRYRQGSPQFMIIPLIDVIFFLLVFFMMNSLQTTTQRAMNISLPQAASAEAAVQVPVVITLDAAGHIMVDGSPVSLAEAAALLRGRVEQNPQAAVVLQADRTTAHGQVTAVMDMLRTAGVHKLGIAADKKE